MTRLTPVLPGPASAANDWAAALGHWSGDRQRLVSDEESIRAAISNLHRPVFVVEHDGAPAVAAEGQAMLGATADAESLPLRGYTPPMRPQQLGDPTFCADMRIRFAYMTGAMANGIASTQLVEAAAHRGLLASFGAAGRSLPQIEQAIDRLQSRLGETSHCFNLIHSPNEPAHEAAVVDLYLRRRVHQIEASAYMDLTLPAVRYRVTGIDQNPDGGVRTPNRIIAKASRIEVATRWFSPPPPAMLEQLVETGVITRYQAVLAQQIPMAQDLTAEADSGGHTDNRPAICLLPTMLALRNRMQQKYQYAHTLRVGAAGGIATPASAAAAFAMGAAYVVTGSINQACIESGSSAAVRQLLAESKQADVTMAPAADMFEMGVKVQVLKRGTMFAMRASRLYETYRSCEGLQQIPAAERATLEKNMFRMSLEQVWEQARQFFLERDPGQVRRAEKDPKHQMALVFRWYLGLSSRWANEGDPTRQVDYQVWCGPAMGAFNEWTKGSLLAVPENRRVADVALNILYGSAVVTRINMLRHQGVRLGPHLIHVEPLPAAQIEDYL